MAFINCPECGHSTSSVRKNCPKCHKPLHPEIFTEHEDKPKGITLIDCHDCGHKISKNAHSCPQCGAVTKLGTRSLLAHLLSQLSKLRKNLNIK